jgi:hypothetical protein
MAPGYWRRWWFGSNQKPSLLLQWLSGPLWRIATIIILVLVWFAPGGVLAWRIAAGGLIGVSIVADLASSLVLRRDRRAQREASSS